jgi:hypothetical protein
MASPSTRSAPHSTHATSLTQETDEDGDGTPDRAVTYTYDDAGHLLTSAFDSYLGEGPCDGTADFVQRQTWRDGRIVEKTADYGNDGDLDGRRVYHYDDAGRVTREWNDEDGDGTWDFLAAYVRDSEGHIATAYMDGMHTLTTHRTLRFDSAKGLHVHEFAMGGQANGTFQRCDYAPPCTSTPTYCMAACEDIEATAVAAVKQLVTGPTP